MTKYIIARRGVNGLPVFALTGKRIDDGPGREPGLVSGYIVHVDYDGNAADPPGLSYHWAKLYDSIKEIAKDPMTHHPHFWDDNRIFLIQELDNP